MHNNIEKIGIIAGCRSLPKLFTQEARAMGISSIICVAFEGETDPEMENLADETIWIKVGQLGKLINAFKKKGVSKCVMLGQVAPKNLFKVQPDIRGASLLFKLKEKNAHTIFGAIAEELQSEGITLISAAPFLKSFMPGDGYHEGRSLSPEDRDEAEFGFPIAKSISELEIGQTVVVKQGTVLAVEGFEGTDQCLIRGGLLAGKKGGATAVKVAKKNHDMRFDIPCLGYTTLEKCAENGINNLVFEAGMTLLLDKEMWMPKLKSWKISLMSFSGS